MLRRLASGRLRSGKHRKSGDGNAAPTAVDDVRLVVPARPQLIGGVELGGNVINSEQRVAQLEQQLVASEAEVLRLREREQQLAASEAEVLQLRAKVGKK